MVNSNIIIRGINMDRPSYNYGMCLTYTVVGILILLISGCQKHTLTTPEFFYVPPGKLITLKLEAEQGNVESAVKVADHYLNVENDLEQYIKYATIAAESGDAVVQYNLGSVLLTQCHKKQYHKEAMAWLIKSAKNGMLYAQKHLAIIYETGEFCTADDLKAKYWYEQSAQQGDVASLIKLADFNLLGKGCVVNRSKAYALLLIAEKLVNKKSMRFKEIYEKKEELKFSENEKEKGKNEFNKLIKVYLKAQSE